MLKAFHNTILVFFIISVGNAYSQIDSLKNPLTIQINLLRAVSLEGAVEVVLPGKVVQVKILGGVLYNIPFMSDQMMAWGTTDNGLYSGFLVGAGARINHNRFRAYYYDFDVYYRYREYFNEFYYFGGAGGTSQAELLNLSKVQNVLSIRGILGGFPANDRKIHLGGYVGAGANLISEKVSQYDCRYCSTKVQNWNIIKVKPTVHLGIKLELNFFQ